jgi:hypothetical protein
VASQPLDSNDSAFNARNAWLTKGLLCVHLSVCVLPSSIPTTLVYPNHSKYITTFILVAETTTRLFIGADHKVNIAGLIVAGAGELKDDVLCLLLLLLFLFLPCN